VAHEIFHLYNGERFHTDLGPAEEWLSEGSADYFAMRAAATLGVTDEAFFREQIVEAANLCILRLEGRPLVTAHQRGDHGNFYTCGATLLFALDQGVQRATSKKADLGTVFRNMFKRADGRGNGYSTFDLLRAAVEVSGDPQIGAPIEVALHAGLEKNVDQFFARVFRDAGWDVVATSDVNDVIPAGHLIHALAARLTRCDCPKRRSFTVSGRQLTFGGSPDCHTINDPFEIATVGSVDLARDPARALFTTLADMTADKPITLTSTSNVKQVLRCDPPIHDASFSGLLRLNTP
jgi:hypothetical protein